MCRISLLLGSITLAVTSGSGQAQDVTNTTPTTIATLTIPIIPKPKIIPIIDPKAVWLLESAAAKLRAVHAVKAVSRGYIYYLDRDTAPAIITTDTVRLNRSKGGYKYHTEVAHNGFYWSVLTVGADRCLNYSRTVNPAPNVGEMSLARVAAELGAKAFATVVQGGATRCSYKAWDDNIWWFPNSLQALNSREVGQRMDVGEWGIERLDDPMLHSITYTGKKIWSGRAYDVVQFSYENGATLPKYEMVYITTMYIDTDQIVRRVITTNSKGNYSTDDQILSIELNTPVTESDLTWKLPAGIVLKDPSYEERHALGQTIPRFVSSGQLLDGTPVTASDLIKGKKGILFWFWNTGCSSCMEKFPHLEQLYQEYKNQGIQIVALNVADPSVDLDNSKEYQAYHRSTMPIVFVNGDWKDWTEKNWFYVADGTGRIVYEYGDHLNKAKLRSWFAKLASQ